MHVSLRSTCSDVHVVVLFSLRRRQSEENCRKFFQQAVNSVTDDPGRMCEAYLQYEREQGSLETFETAVKRTRTQMERIKEREKSVREAGLDGGVATRVY